ncbi:MAG: hypothetical protein LBS20_03560 [Prevotella sp.]|jgi:hypothetical protein|nr:hypothetical protein [Prevotella sp.]
MDRIILEKELEKLGVKKNYYSLFGDLQSDATILYQNYNKWEIFYLDERGGRHPEGIFDNEEEACLFMYELLKKSRETELKYKLNGKKNEKD